MDLPDSPIIEESMQRDNNDNRDELIKKLSEDLERAKRQIENQTRTIDRIMQSLDSKDKSIADLKLDAVRRCESKMRFYIFKIYIISLIMLFVCRSLAEKSCTGL